MSTPFLPEWSQSSRFLQDMRIWKRQLRLNSIVSSPAVLAVGDDKVATSKWLKDRGFGFGRCARTEDIEEIRRLAAECGFPLIAKPRRGKGSYGITVIDNDAELQRFVRTPDYMVQEYLGSPDGNLRRHVGATTLDEYAAASSCGEG